MTNIFTTKIEITESSVKGFIKAINDSNSRYRKKQNILREKRRERINKLRLLKF